ncbi:hypothetical protein Hanom_Chr07g00594041 [Helianthus anomalus]
MATKVKPQGPKFKKFEIWTKMAKVPKPQGPKWQFTLNKISVYAFFLQIHKIFFPIDGAILPGIKGAVKNFQEVQTKIFKGRDFTRNLALNFVFSRGAPVHLEI